MRLSEIASRRGTSAPESVADLIVESNNSVAAVYFLMSEENVKKQLRLPWISFGSDGDAIAPEGDVLKRKPHPRSYGNFARFLGKYVRDEQLIPLEEAVRRLTLFPATTLGIQNRGRLAPGYFADLAIFDPATIQDHATFENPHAYATGMVHVFVNGEQVLKNGEHTGATPGRIVRGPGWTGR